MINNNNQKTYSSLGVVQHYAELSTLQHAEATILKLLQAQSGNMKMLDIGVGGVAQLNIFLKLFQNIWASIIRQI